MKGESCSTCPTKSACAGGCARTEAELAEMYDLEADTTEGHMVWAELDYDEDGQSLSSASAEILHKASLLDDQRVIAVMFGPEGARELASDLHAIGADTVYHVRNKGFTSFQLETFTEGLTAVARRVNPNTLLLPASPDGMELGPRTAARLGVGITADCTDLTMERGVLRMTRPTFGGKMMATIISETRPQMATVRPGTFPNPGRQSGRRGTVINWPLQPVSGLSATDEVILDSCATTGELIISVGAGIGSLKNLDLAKEAAERLGAELACSRSVVEKGWLPQADQVGQTGRSVAPRVYLALGISGAVQHQVGMSRSQKIIAVNNDPDATIHRIANVSIIGDVGDFLRQLLHRLDAIEPV